VSFARLFRSRARKLALAPAVAAVAVGVSLSACSPVVTPKTVAKNMMWGYGWGDAQQFACLDNLWTRESNWDPNAANPYSGAYGIPQALPGGKMAAAGADWATNPETQIRWGLNYIKGVYGSPCGAWSHSMATGWY
jgi:hypothetical protein